MQTNETRQPESAAERLLSELRGMLPADAVIERSAAGISTYARDGFVQAAGDPLAVVLPRSTAQVSALMRKAWAAGVSVMPRGAGTSRCGGAMPPADSLVMSTSRMKEVIDFDPVRGRIRVQPGLTNQAVSEHVRAHRWFYAPDPSSRRTCTIGGNIAVNSSGACAVRHGATGQHLLGLTAVLQDGEVLELGVHGPGASRYDLLGFLCGSEGQLALVTEATLSLTAEPPRSATWVAGFGCTQGALDCASAILRCGIVPQRLELMDRHAVAWTEAVAPSGYDLHAAATLLVELHGLPDEVDDALAQLQNLAGTHGAVALQQGPTQGGATDLWKGRTAIYSAASHRGDFECLDCCVPRSQLQAALDAVARLAATNGVEHATVAHAADGTLHALLVLARSVPDGARQLARCGDAIRAACVALGGAISAEYGIGLARRELLALQYGPRELEQQWRARAAFASAGVLNPGKVLPSLPAGIDSLWTAVPQGEAAVAACLPTTRVLLPQTEAAAAQMVRDARAGGQRLRTAERGDAGHARLSSQALTGITHHVPDDFVVTVRAGTTVAALTASLAARGQRLAFEAPEVHGFGADRAATTVGAVAACDLSGPCRMAGGGARDHILGLCLVNGRGEVLRCGARALKNVAGLDLTKLVVGSRGSLGLVTEVSLRVEALPEARLTLAWPGRPDALLQLLARARGEGLQPVLGLHACQRTAQAIGLPAPVGGLNLVHFDGRPSAVQAHAACFEALLPGERAAIHQQDADRAWRALRDLDAFATPSVRRVWHVDVQQASSLDLLGRVAALPHARLQVDGCGRQAWLALPDAEALGDAQAMGALARLAATPLHGARATAPQPSARMAQLTSALRLSFDPFSVFATGE